MAGIGSSGDRKGSAPTGRLTEATGPFPTAAPVDTNTPPAGTPAQKRDTASLSGGALAKAHAKAANDPLATYPSAQLIEREVALNVAEVDHDGVVGSAKQYWHDMRKDAGAAGYLGATMETLLEFSGLPAVERSSAELGTRVGMGDTKTHIAKAGGKLAFDSGMVLLNGLAAGGALASAGKAAKTLAVGEAALDTVATTATIVRHYTSAETAIKIMQSGEIWATKTGMAGGDKVYLLAENAGSRGMNFLRQLNIGVAKTGTAVEFDMSKVPAEVAQRFRVEGFRGFFNQENFVTHGGKLDFRAFQDAVKVVTVEKLPLTFDQILKAGGSLTSVGVGAEDVGRGSAGLANVTH
jgi:hypothetical protein